MKSLPKRDVEAGFSAANVADDAVVVATITEVPPICPATQAATDPAPKLRIALAIGDGAPGRHRYQTCGVADMHPPTWQSTLRFTHR